MRGSLSRDDESASLYRWHEVRSTEYVTCKVDEQKSTELLKRSVHGFKEKLLWIANAVPLVAINYESHTYVKRPTVRIDRSGTP